MAVKFGRGFGKVEEEQKRREIAQESRKGKLFRFFFKKEEEVPIRFLTEVPVTYHEHSIKSGDRFDQIPCTDDADCPYCGSGNRPAFVASWLVVDRREFEAKVFDENGQDTGKKKMVRDRLKVLVRGMTDAASLKRLSEKYGLMDRPYTVTKTGTGKNTKWDFDRGEPEAVSAKQLAEWKSQLDKKYDGKDFYEILEMQLVSDGGSVVSQEEVKKAASAGVQRLEDEEVPTPVKKKFSKVK
jgi:hypothetical protein